MTDLLNLKVETERLLLVSISPDYAEDIFKEFTPEITLWMAPSSPNNISETYAFIDGAVLKMREGRDYVVAILNKETGEFLGGGGLHRVNTKTPEIGIWIKKSAHGQRIGREAVVGLKKWADENLVYEYIIYPADRRNIPSRKIPESLGGVLVKEELHNRAGREPLECVVYYIYP